MYQYTYPTFTDAPQQICIHFLTPDQKEAFLSYPNHPKPKAAQLVDIRWFESVELVKLDGQPQLMHFLENILPSWFNKPSANMIPLESIANERTKYGVNVLSIAFG
ncbi:hypothetical protein [Spirosoma endophyticum]|nr:hypothetical protein [Spirosoma endophyticum]